MRINVQSGIPANAKSSEVVIRLLLEINGLGEVLIFLMYFARVEFLRAISLFRYAGNNALGEMASTR